MRCSVLLCAAIALTVTRASADTGDSTPTRNLLGSPKKDKAKPKAQGLPPSAPAREASYADGTYYNAPPAGPAAAPSPSAPSVFTPTDSPTPIPAGKIVGPVIGGVVGAGALAGVIAISVMKKPKPSAAGEAAEPTINAEASGPEAPAPAPLPSTDLTQAASVGDTQIEVSNPTGFVVGDTIKVGSEYQLVKGCCAPIILDHPMNTAQGLGAMVQVIADKRTTTPAPAPAPASVPLSARVDTGAAPTDAPATSSSGMQASSGSTQNTVLAVSIGLVVCGLCTAVLLCALYFMFGRKKKKRSPPRQETPFVETPEDQQPLNQASMMSTMVDMQQSDPDLMQSQYMQVNVPPLAPQAAPVTGNIGSIPTMQNVVPMQTMPPPPPVPVAMSYTPQAAGTSVYAQAGQSVYSQGASVGASVYQNASPLANTVSALPTYQNVSYQSVPPTIY